MPQLPPSADCWFPLSPPSTSCSNPRLSIWALCLLLFLLLLLLLLIVCCALSLCFGIGWRFQDKIWPRKVSKTDEISALPTFSPEPFSHPPARTIPAVVNESSQTMAPQTPPWDSEWGEQQNQKKKEWEKERHVALPLRELTKKDRAIEETWWKLEENIQTEEEQTEEVISTEWREGEEAMWRKKDEWTARGQWNGAEAEEKHQRQQEERRHYENWSRPAATSDRFHHAPVAWTTHFGKEPMAAVLAGEEEDRIEWRTTEPNGATVREGGTTKYRQKSTF
uniref:Uncharacterized protein n=1 Tax=Globodera pallida TaxID=36090 RepID=A0A183CKK5_GLOPA